MKKKKKQEPEIIKEKTIKDYIFLATNEFKIHDASEHFFEICNQVIASQNPSWCLTFAKTFPKSNIKALGKVVAEFGSAKENLAFINIEGCDTRIHREAIFKSEDLECNLYIGKYSKDKCCEEYVNKHGKIVLEKGESFELFKFIHHNKCKSLNKKLFLDKIIALHNPSFNIKCAEEIEGADIEAHGKVILKYGSIWDNYRFAKIPGADTASHLQVVLNSKDPYYNFMIVQQISNCDIFPHAKVVFDGNDNEIKNAFLKFVEENNRLDEIIKISSVRQFIDDKKNHRIQIDTDFEI